jgi:FkbH-like protein
MFSSIDVPRLAQLINKSNQFNLTTHRRSEAEVEALIGLEDWICLSVRLEDRFGEHGLISIVIGQVINDTVLIDTWVMSCRVLKRQVEDTVLNELARRSQEKGCTSLHGVYRPTAKNDMVRDFYTRMGFELVSKSDEQTDYKLDLKSFQPRSSKITVRNAQ